MLFHFYNGHANASSAFQYIYLPKNMSNRQDLLQPWEMRRTLIYKPSESAKRGVPPPGSHIFGPPRDERYWEPVGITVDEDTLPHILTFTACTYKGACERLDDEAGAPLPVFKPFPWKQEL